MQNISTKMRNIALSGCSALSLIGSAFATTPAQALALPKGDVSFLGVVGGAAIQVPVSTRLPLGRHYARRAGLYTCGATNIHTHLNRQACGGNSKMQTYPD